MRKSARRIFSCKTERLVRWNCVLFSRLIERVEIELFYMQPCFDALSLGYLSRVLIGRITEGQRVNGINSY